MVHSALGGHGTAAPNTVVAILGGGRPHEGVAPSALQSTGTSVPVLNWTFDAFANFSDVEFHFLGGYRVDDVMRSFPNIKYSINEDWGSSGSLLTLAGVNTRSVGCMYVCYSDVVFRPDVVAALEDGGDEDVVIAIDSQWQHRHRAHPERLELAEKVCLRDGWVVACSRERIHSGHADGVFAGVMRLGARAIERFSKMREHRLVGGDESHSAGDERRSAWQRGGMPDLITEFLCEGLNVRAVDIAGNWAELRGAQDLARFVLGTKAQTLERLRSKISLGSIGEQIRVSHLSWQQDREAVQRKVARQFAGLNIAVRSCAAIEDGWDESKAGHFKSLLSVCADDATEVTEAVETVFASYGTPIAEDEVLIQKMVEDSRASGVVLTRTLGVGGPYYTVNFNDVSSATDAVTGSGGHGLRHIVVFRGLDLSKVRPPQIRRVVQATREIEQLLQYDALDIEFAVDREDAVHILQTRPIARQDARHFSFDDDIEDSVKAAQSAFETVQKPCPSIVGDSTIFGVMPDWNPAEVIGTKPRPLALSLYRYLITDEIWARQRAEFGYRDVRPCPLILEFCGQPYVDVRASFNSFVPRDLSESLATKLVGHYVHRLRTNPELHDKIEFKIAVTALTFGFSDRRAELQAQGFFEQEVNALEEGLRSMTAQAMTQHRARIAGIDRMRAGFDEILAAALPPLARAFTFLDDCREYGTLPFSHAARNAFVAVSFLRDMVDQGLLTSVSEVVSRIPNVTSQMERDAVRVKLGTLPWDDFASQYGHLRPGTYEITSPCYASDPQRFLRPLVDSTRSDDPEPGVPRLWSTEIDKTVCQRLRSIGLPHDADVFQDFVRESIAGREMAKFHFSRNLSLALEDLARFGDDLDMSREEVSYLSIFDLLKARVRPLDSTTVERLRDLAAQGANDARRLAAIELPPLLTCADDFVHFELLPGRPNFVGDASIVADLLVHSLHEPCDDANLRGKVVLIRRADPGYDWLFGCGIAGLVTAYGGVNSHMAIRCAELGLPGAIGIGEREYQRLSSGRAIELDCGRRSLRLL